MSLYRIVVVHKETLVFEIEAENESQALDRYAQTDEVESDTLSWNVREIQVVEPVKPACSCK